MILLSAAQMELVKMHGSEGVKQESQENTGTLTGTCYRLPQFLVHPLHPAKPDQPGTRRWQQGRTDPACAYHSRKQGSITVQQVYMIGKKHITLKRAYQHHGNCKRSHPSQPRTNQHLHYYL